MEPSYILQTVGGRRDEKGLVYLYFKLQIIYEP